MYGYYASMKFKDTKHIFLDELARKTKQRKGKEKKIKEKRLALFWWCKLRPKVENSTNVGEGLQFLHHLLKEEKNKM